MIAWFTTILCLVGTILNVKRMRACFYLWAIGNILWLILDFKSGLYSRTLLDLVQLGFAIWGIFEWSEKK